MLDPWKHRVFELQHYRNLHFLEFSSLENVTTSTLNELAESELACFIFFT